MLFLALSAEDPSTFRFFDGVVEVALDGRHIVKRLQVLSGPSLDATVLTACRSIRSRKVVPEPIQGLVVVVGFSQLQNPTPAIGTGVDNAHLLDDVVFVGLPDLIGARLEHPIRSGGVISGETSVVAARPHPIVTKDGAPTILHRLGHDLDDGTWTARKSER
jgi:hypothetical protein